MGEWVFEPGIGEARAALIAGGGIIEARIERPGLRLGTVAPARLIERRGTRALVRMTGEAGNGGEAILQSVPPGLSEGAALVIEIVREAIPERGNPKLPLAIASAADPAPGPSLDVAIGAARVLTGHDPDLLEQAGWSELVEQAATGLVPFAGGLLRISVTPAMTLIDIDGDLPPAELARRGAAAAGAAIRRFDIGGSIGVDLPTMPDKAARQAAAQALDAALPAPFERTAVNGFGFLQIVRRRLRPSLCELVQADPVLTAALALLRRVERSQPPPGPLMLVAAPPVIARIAAAPGWTDALGRRLGARIGLRADPAQTIWGGHAEPDR